MNINFNWNNIKKVLCIGIAGSIIGLGAGYFIGKNMESKSDNKPKTPRMVEVKSVNPCHKLTYEGVDYATTDDYNLEVINGNVLAVKRFYYIDEPETTTDENGNEIYIGPSNSFVLEGTRYREYPVYERPIVLGKHIGL